LEQLQKEINNDLGAGSAILARDQPPLEVISTGILALDFALGIGGYPRGHLTGAFGARDIGKSSILGLSGVRSAQALGENAAWISTEHKFDKEWARKLGVDVDRLLLTFPDTGEKAFEALYKIVKSGAVAFVVFDSIGALLNESEITGTENKDAKMKMGGRANLITWGVHRVLGPVAKNKVAVLLLNQQRQIMSPTGPGGFQQPGGEALEHNEVIIIQLKNAPGTNSRTTWKDEHGDEQEIGREIMAHVLRNQVTQGSKQKAFFKFWNKETPDYPFGIDAAYDIVNTGKRSGVIRGTTWLEIDGLDQKFNGKDKLKEFFDANPGHYERLRAAILEKVHG